MNKRWVTSAELKIARHVVCKAHGINPITAENYLDYMTGSILQRYDVERRMYLTTEKGKQLIQQLASPHGHALLKAHEAVHGVPDLNNLPWK